VRFANSFEYTIPKLMYFAQLLEAASHSSQTTLPLASIVMDTAELATTTAAATPSPQQ
jgi:hypothetical protein